MNSPGAQTISHKCIGDVNLAMLRTNNLDNIGSRLFLKGRITVKKLCQNNVVCMMGENEHPNTMLQKVFRTIVEYHINGPDSTLCLPLDY